MRHRVAAPILVLAILVLSRLPLAAAEGPQGPPRDQPNILWITCEDISPNLGCYGDAYAVTPNLDRLAARGVRYTHAFAPIGVCAPSRSTLILGVFAPTVGTHHMRCQGNLPEPIKCFPEYLRRAGYYCSNNVKTDYNFPVPAGAWNDSSNKAHWRNRKAGQPFFSVFNFTTCHESQIRLTENQYQARVARFTEAEKHDPARAPLPPYHPDEPEVRRDWARYADMITFMDKQAGDVLRQLEEDGLAENTIVFFFSDHGAGMPRSKRWLYDSSTRVPFVVFFPRKYAGLSPGPAGSTCDRLVSFVDFGPTVLSLAGVSVPGHMQGRPFLGSQAAAPREYVFGFRDRMDERYDMVRSARDRRYKYIRNYHPELPYFHHQYVSYMYEMPTMKVWQRLADAGRLAGPQAVFMARTKPMEELYDTAADPWEVSNLAARPEHQETLERLRKASRGWMRESLDLGLLPEADLRTRFGDRAEYQAAREKPGSYPLERIAAAADLANAGNAENRNRLVELLRDEDAAVRYWAATGLGMLGKEGQAVANPLRVSLEDSAAVVRVAAADALCRLERYELAVPALARALEDSNPWVRLYAVNVLDRIDEHARPAMPAIQAAKGDKNQYVVRVVEHILEKGS